MKNKLLIGFMAVIMAVSFTACGNKETNSGETKTEATNKVDIPSSADALNKVFDTYAEEERFMIMGGDFENVVDGKAGVYNMEDTEGLASTVHISADLIAQIDEVASAVHGMNANNFTAAAFRLKDANSTEAFTKSLKESVLSTQWVCGFPEKIIMYTLNDDYVVYAIGSADLVDNFTKKLEAVYGDVAISVTNEPIE